MSSPPVVVDNQRPTSFHLPKFRARSDIDLAVEFAESAGLFLDEWQRWVLEQALYRRRDDKWSAFDVLLAVPRQNGKGAVLEALILYHLYVLRTSLTVYSAHEFKTATETFLRIKSLIENDDELRSLSPSIMTANGKESITTTFGSRLKIVARSRGSLRGFSAECLICDEAYDLPRAVIGAALPTVSAQPNPQVWYVSSAPHSDSELLHSLLDRMDKGQEARLFGAEWGNPEGTEDSKEAVHRVNPGHPHRLNEDNLDAERPTLLASGEYERERLGIRSRLEGTEPGIIDPAAWANVCDDNVELEMESAFFAADMSEDRTYAGIVAFQAGQIEVVDYREGVGWLEDRIVELYEKYRKPFAIDGRGPVSTVIEPCKRRTVTFTDLSSELVRATGDMLDAINDRAVKVRTDTDLDRAAMGASKRDVGDAFVWTRKNSSAEISLLVAATLARYAGLQAVDPASQVF